MKDKWKVSISGGIKWEIAKNVNMHSLRIQGTALQRAVRSGA